MTSIDWPVRTERLALRPYLPDDLDELWAFEQLPSVQHWLGWAPDSLDDSAGAMNDESSTTMHLMALLGISIIGHIMIMPRDGWAQSDIQDQAEAREAELGWMFDPEYGGNGYASEAVRAAVGCPSARSRFGGCTRDALPTTWPPGG